MLRNGHIRILLKELEIATIRPGCKMQYIQLLRILRIVVEQKCKIVILEVTKLQIRNSTLHLLIQEHPLLSC